MSTAASFSIIANSQSPPCIVTTSPKGDLLVMVETSKKLEEYSEKQFVLILFPANQLGDCRVTEEDEATAVQMSPSNKHCTFWELDDVEHCTHVAMDKLGIIYFTNGESVFRISKAQGDMYLDDKEDIFSPSNDTSHITCLWRQNNDIYITLQDWDNEEVSNIFVTLETMSTMSHHGVVAHCFFEYRIWTCTRSSRPRIRA